MMMLVGDESLQFRFVDAENNLIEDFQFRYNKDNKWLITENENVYLQHLTLDIKDITSEEGREKKYKTWQMPIAGWKSAPLDAAQKYYLYAKCSKTGDTGVFEISQAAIAMDKENSTDYYFLVGVLNTEYEGERSYVSLYGFTEILPGRITTDRVVSGDGESYLDFVNNIARIGNNNRYLAWNVIAGLLEIMGASITVKNQDGETVASIDGETGAAMFAKGNAVMNADGSVNIIGSITNYTPGASKPAKTVIDGANIYMFFFDPWTEKHELTGQWNSTCFSLYGEGYINGLPIFEIRYLLDDSGRTRAYMRNLPQLDDSTLRLGRGRLYIDSNNFVKIAP
jgi:hypothetical protein